MSILFTNNASATLSAPIDGDAPGPESTQLVLQSNEASLFPNPSDPNDFFIVTIEDVNGNIEVVKVTDRDLLSDTLTVERGQENTSSQDFAAGSKVECRPTAGTFDEFLQKSGGTITGLIDFNGNDLRDPVITNSGVAEIKGVPIRGADGGTANELVVPTLSGAPTIGNEVIIHQGNDDAYVKTTRNITAGEGLAGGGALSGDLNFAFDVTSLGFLQGFVDPDDRVLVLDASVNTHKQVRYRNIGVPVISTANPFTPDDDDMNSYIRMTSGTAVDFTLNTNVGDPGNVLIVEQAGAGQVTVTGSATINSAYPGKITREQYSVIVLLCTSANTWTLYGDAE